ncbi:hypothetical protein YQE_03099, partial [Dendroctonus ponderosae]
MSIVVEKIAEIPNLMVGEGPHRDVRTQALYFVDIIGKSVHKYVPATGQHTKATFDKAASLVIPVKGQRDKFVVNQLDEIVVAFWDGHSEKLSKIEKSVDINQPDTSLNDGKCDAMGRLWTGIFFCGRKITSVGWGGAGLDVLYVTSASVLSRGV